MVEFLPCPQSQSSDYNKEQHPNEISIELDDSFYILLRTDLGVFDVKFEGIAFPRNSICFSGVLFTVSSLSLWFPFHALDLDISHGYWIIPRQTTRILPSYDGTTLIRFIAFEFGSQLTRIDSCAFYGYRGLRSICLPRSVETICTLAFANCTELSSLTFERSSSLTRIEESLFTWSWFWSDLSIHLPASLQILHYNAFPCRRISQITIEEGNRNFRVSGDFLMAVECVTVVRYFGLHRHVTLGRDIETLGIGSFS
jgi:hypothetical protein